MRKNFKEFGSLGDWNKIDEKTDVSIVKQMDETCVSAVGEMLAEYYGLKITQAEILDEIGILSNSTALAKFFNSKETENSVKWEGGGWQFETPIGALKWLVENYKIGAMLRNKSAKGHAVFIDGFDENGLVIVKDPFDQTVYKMKIENFSDVLSEFVWRKRK